MTFVRKIWQQNVAVDFGGGFASGYLVVGFTPAAAQVVNVIRVNRTAATAIGGDLGIATAIGANPPAITWLSRNSAANFNATGWIANFIPQASLAASTLYYVVLGTPNGGDSAKVGTCGTGGAGPDLGGNTGAITYSLSTNSAGAWITQNPANYVPGFEIGADIAAPTKGQIWPRGNP